LRHRGGERRLLQRDDDLDACGVSGGREGERDEPADDKTPFQE
jgi:hypothetical protein